MKLEPTSIKDRNLQGASHTECTYGREIPIRSENSLAKLKLALIAHREHPHPRYLSGNGFIGSSAFFLKPILFSLSSSFFVLLLSDRLTLAELSEVIHSGL